MYVEHIKNCLKFVQRASKPNGELAFACGSNGKHELSKYIDQHANP